MHKLQVTTTQTGDRETIIPTEGKEMITPTEGTDITTDPTGRRDGGTGKTRLQGKD